MDGSKVFEFEMDSFSFFFQLRDGQIAVENTVVVFATKVLTAQQARKPIQWNHVFLDQF